MDKEKILNKMQAEIDDFLYQDVDLGGGARFNQYETLKRIGLTLNSEFEDKSLYAGREKIFFNISVPHKDSILKFYDVDVKDVRAISRKQGIPFASVFMTKEFIAYLEEEGMSEKFNELADEMGSWGAVVIKHNNSEPQIVDLNNLFCDPGADNLQDARFVTLLHYMTPKQLREKIEDGWDADAIERVITSVKDKQGENPSIYLDEKPMHQVTSTKYIEVYERYGQIDGKEMVFVVAEPFLNKIKDSRAEKQGEILYQKERKGERPFEEFHYQKIRGRWLGQGIIEKLFIIQERANEIANQKRISMEVSAMHLFQTADPTVLNNLLNDLENGSVIKTRVQGSLQPVVNEERNLPAFQLEQQEYLELANRTTFSNDIITGQDIPATTPATNVLIANNNTVKNHLRRRENFVLFLRRYVKNYLLPDFVSKIDNDHILRYVVNDSDSRALDSAFVEIALQKSIRENLKRGIVTYQPFADIARDKLSKELKERGSDRFAKLLKGYYRENLPNIDIVIDNENRDLSTEANNIQQFLMTVNVQALGDPVYRAFVNKYAEIIGIDIYKLEKAFSERAQELPSEVPSKSRRPRSGQTQQSLEDEFLARPA